MTKAVKYSLDKNGILNSKIGNGYIHSYSLDVINYLEDKKKLSAKEEDKLETFKSVYKDKCFRNIKKCFEYTDVKESVGFFIGKNAQCRTYITEDGEVETENYINENRCKCNGQCPYYFE